MAISLFISVAILLFLLTSGDRKSRLNWLFVRIIICNIAGLVIALFITVLDGTGLAFVDRLCVFLGFALVNLLVPLLADYIYALIGRNTQISRAIPHLIYVLYFIWLISLIVSQFNGMYYYFDENQKYAAGEYFYMVQIFAVLSLPGITAVVLWHRKKLDKSDVLYLLIFPLFIIITFSFQIFVNQDFAGIYFSITFFALFCYGGIQARQAKMLKDKELEISNAHVNIMLSQIQPHFLYNSLAVIRHLCKTDPKLAEETVMEFSDYLRGNLDSLTDNKLIPFERELHHVETYLSIEKKRFGDKLNIVYKIETKDFLVPVLSLQPIVENAVRYGITKKEQGGTVEIRTEETENCFLIAVKDDGLGFNTDDKTKTDNRSHIGIENTRNRLAALCNASLEIQSALGEGTVAVIRIPKQVSL